MINEEHTCSVHDLSEFLNITGRRVQQLVDKGVIKRGDRGKYLFLPSLKAYIKFIQEAAYGDRAIGTDLQAARARESKLKGDKLILEIAQSTGQLVLVDQIEPALEAWAAMGRSEVLNAFHKVIADIEGRHAFHIDESALLTHIDSALKAIANYPQLGPISPTLSESNRSEITDSIIQSNSDQEEPSHGH